MNRPARLAYLQRLLYRNPLGYRSSELAALCHTSQRTINRDLEELQDEPFALPLAFGGVGASELDGGDGGVAAAGEGGVVGLHGSG